MNKIRIVLLGFLTFFSLELFSQEIVEPPLESFDAYDFCKAKTVYAAILKNKPYDSMLNFRYGECLFEIGEFAQAYKPLELASKKIPQAYLYLGDLKMKEYKFQEALGLYKTGLSHLQPNELGVEQFQQKIEMVAKAEHMLKAIQEIEIVDSMFVGKTDFFKHYMLGRECGEIFVQRASLDSLIKTPYTGFITERDDRKIFSDTIDGKCDLFIQNRLLDGWSDVTPLSATVNSKGNENFPFLQQDGVTLYYCSDGPLSIGGYDILVTRSNPEGSGYFMPENVGMPFNSPFNDYLMAIDEVHGMGWFATDRYQPKDSVVIYRFKYSRERNYLDVDDKEEALEYAKLKKYKLLTQETDVNAQFEDGLRTSTRKVDTMSFIINDTLIYSSVNDFKSEQAKSTYIKAVEYDENISGLKKQLSYLRGTYSQSPNKAEKDKLMYDIVEKEQELRKLESEPNPYYVDARNQEIRKIEEQGTQESQPNLYDF